MVQDLRQQNSGLWMGRDTKQFMSKLIEVDFPKQSAVVLSFDDVGISIIILVFWKAGKG